MPSPGVAVIASDLGDVSFVLSGGITTEYKSTGRFMQELAQGMDAGWTSATPTTTTTMAATLESLFAVWMGNPSGRGSFTAIGQGIDEETGLWAASWNAQSGVHTYVPSAVSIVSKILAAAPLNTPAIEAIATAAADVFIAYFEQEVG